ncbi:MAG: ferrous iron transporter B [Bacillota bacterium]
MSQCCHSVHARGTGGALPLPPDFIALAGNPNAGKSLLFQRLTGAYAEVSNYPGTTLEITWGRWGSETLVDTPGVYGLSSFNPEEQVARDILLGARRVINVVNATHLERDLFLTQQLIDAGLAIVVALNMMDEAEALGLRIDVEGLSRELGVPVVPIVARTGRGVDRLAEAVSRAAPGRPTPAVIRRLGDLPPAIPRPEALLILEGDPEVAGRWGEEPRPFRDELYRARRERVEGICARVVALPAQETWGDRLSRLLIRPFPGLPILAGLLWLTYKAVGEGVAGSLVGLLEEGLMQRYYEPLVRDLVGRLVGEESPLFRVLAGEFGVLTMTVTYVVGVILPLVAAFYLVLSILEDTGYLPRIATLLDRVMGAIGLNGKAIIPLILGLGCVTMAVITTRMLSSERERRLATYLLALAVPCSAQLGVVTLLLARAGVGSTLLYALVVLTVFVSAGLLLDALLPGEAPPLFLDLPPLRLPEPRNVLLKTWVRTRHFLTEATPLFALGALVLGVLEVTGILTAVQGWLAPLTEGWLGLPREAATAFVMGFVRRDFGAVGMSTMPLTPAQTVTALATITLFVPCIASTLVLLKERGRAEGALIWLAAVATAFLVGGLVHHSVRLGGAILGAAGAPWVTVLGCAAAVAGAAALSQAVRHRRLGAMERAPEEAAD